MTQEEIQQVLESLSSQAYDISDEALVSNPQMIANVLSLPGMRTDTQEYVRIPYSAIATLAETIALEVIRGLGMADRSYLRVNTPNGVKYILFANGIMAGVASTLPAEYSSASDLTNA